VGKIRWHEDGGYQRKNEASQVIENPGPKTTINNLEAPMGRGKPKKKCPFALKEPLGGLQSHPEKAKIGGKKRGSRGSKKQPTKPVGKQKERGTKKKEEAALSEQREGQIGETEKTPRKPLGKKGGKEGGIFKDQSLGNCAGPGTEKGREGIYFFIIGSKSTL